jgi:hypothetical protein
MVFDREQRHKKGEDSVGARHELNKAHVLGSLALAGLLALVTGSVAVFCVAAIILIGAAIYSGDIRGRGGRR